MEPREYLTVDEVASRLRLTPRTIRKKIQAGEMTANRTGRKYRISVQDFAAYERKTKTTSEEDTGKKVA